MRRLLASLTLVVWLLVGGSEDPPRAPDPIGLLPPHGPTFEIVDRGEKKLKGNSRATNKIARLTTSDPGNLTRGARESWRAKGWRQVVPDIFEEPQSGFCVAAEMANLSRADPMEYGLPHLVSDRELVVVVAFYC